MCKYQLGAVGEPLGEKYDYISRGPVNGLLERQAAN